MTASSYLQCRCWYFIIWYLLICQHKSFPEAKFVCEYSILQSISRVYLQEKYKCVPKQMEMTNLGLKNKTKKPVFKCRSLFVWWLKKHNHFLAVRDDRGTSCIKASSGVWKRRCSKIGSDIQGEETYPEDLQGWILAGSYFCKHWSWNSTNLFSFSCWGTAHEKAVIYS